MAQRSLLKSDFNSFLSQKIKIFEALGRGEDVKDDVVESAGDPGDVEQPDNLREVVEAEESDYESTASFSDVGVGRVPCELSSVDADDESEEEEMLSGQVPLSR